jgi:hypothetical protein
MNRLKPFVLFTAVAISLTAFYSTGTSQNEVPGETLARMQKLGEELAATNEKHAFLQRFVGEWETSTSALGLPNENGTATFKMILGGRFLDGLSSGTIAGVPYVSRTTIGFDNFKNLFCSTFIDDLNTSMRFANGSLDESGSILSLHGTIDHWMNGERDKPCLYRFKSIDDSQFTFELLDITKEIYTPVIKTAFKRTLVNDK